MPAPAVYLTDLTYADFDPADLFDLAFLLRSSEHDLRAVCLPSESDGDRILDELTVRVPGATAYLRGVAGLRNALQLADEPTNLIVVGGYEIAATLLTEERELFREKVARLFLVGGFTNDYSQGREGERLPIDPRLKERNPERFGAAGDRRTQSDTAAFAALLTSGEGVIWLPRDICLWRYAAPGQLAGRGELGEFLLRELFWWNLQYTSDRYDAAAEPALLSSLPALLLATHPDPFLWMRLFRAITARVEVAPSGAITQIEIPTDRPNLYLINAIDSANLSKRITQGLGSGA